MQQNGKKMPGTSKKASDPSQFFPNNLRPFCSKMSANDSARFRNEHKKKFITGFHTLNLSRKHSYFRSVDNFNNYTGEFLNSEISYRSNFVQPGLGILGCLFIESFKEMLVCWFPEVLVHDGQNTRRQKYMTATKFTFAGPRT